jgi:hypothetical protein
MTMKVDSSANIKAPATSCHTSKALEELAAELSEGAARGAGEGPRCLACTTIVTTLSSAAGANGGA